MKRKNKHLTLEYIERAKPKHIDYTPEESAALYTLAFRYLEDKPSEIKHYKDLLFKKVIPHSKSLASHRKFSSDLRKALDGIFPLLREPKI